MKTSFTVGLLMLISIAPFAQKQESGKHKDGWSLVYANDENGRKATGNFQQLVNAVKGGEPVRIGWTLEHPTNKAIRIEHFADAKFITILSDSVVFAQIDPITGQVPVFKDKSVTLKENIEWHFCASSTGNNDSMNLNAHTGEILDHKLFKCGIKWFIKL
jgi:hypothetical protein